MIRLHVYDGERLVARPFDGFDALPEDGWVWLDVLTDEADHVGELGEAFGFDPLALEDVVMADMLPKIDRYDDYSYIALHGLTGDDARIATVEYDVFLADELLVTVRTTDVYGIDLVVEQIEAGHQRPLGSPPELAARIVELGSRRFFPLLDALESRIELLEDRAMRADASVIGEAQALRRDTIVLRRVFGPQRDVLHALSREESLSRSARRAFADVYDHHFRFIESLDAARALITSIQETHRGAIAERTNEVMKVLTVFSATLLPLTLVTGIWGMNLISLPGQQHRWAFWTLMGTMAAIIIGLWIAFARRGFVGGPALRKIPKAVGLTLAHIGTAPLRVVARPVAAVIRAAVSDNDTDRNGDPG